MPGAGLQQPEGQRQPKEPQAPVLLQGEEQPQSRNLSSSSGPVEQLLAGLPLQQVQPGLSALG